MKHSSKPLPKDPNQLAYEIVRLSTEESEERPKPDERLAIMKYLAEIGRKGGLKGGKARAKKLTPTERKRIASNAAKTRWEKNKKSE